MCYEAYYMAVTTNNLSINARNNDHQFERQTTYKRIEK